MQTLKGNIEYIGSGVVVHCYFTTGYRLNPDYVKTMREAKEIIIEELKELIDEVRTGLIHYDFNILFKDQPSEPAMISVINNNNKVPITIYQNKDEIGAELCFGNTMFIESGDVSEGKEKLLLSIKKQVIEVYNYLQEDEYEWGE